MLRHRTPKEIACANPGTGDVVSDLWVLERRYRRWVGFDRWLWVLYALTVAFPVWALCTGASLRGYHAAGIAGTLAVAYLGWRANTRLLKGELRSEALPYFATVAFVVSRVGIAAYGLKLLFEGINAGLEGEFPRFAGADVWKVLGGILTAPPIMYALFAAGCYRVFYHLAVHFLLKIQRVKARAG